MAGVNWQIFEALPRSPEKNFEEVCRAVVRIHYEKYGEFISLAQQPGVEFHLRLTTNCSLGKKDDWFGWQCRWYSMASGINLGAGKKSKISEALAKSLTEIPGLTHWILWTRYPLTKQDQKWFRALTSKVKLVLKSAEDLEPLLGGDASVLRNTFFGEAILTPSSLSELHSSQVARVRRRWIPEAHQSVEAEREVRRMLIDPVAWGRLAEIVTDLKELHSALEPEDGLSVDILPQLTLLWTSITSTEKASKQIATALKSGDLDVLSNVIERLKPKKLAELSLALRTLRNANACAALFATNIVSCQAEFYKLLKRLSGYIKPQVIAIVANAGGGKTQLSAELTAENGKRPAGLLLFGQQLSAGDDLNDFGKQISICGKPVADFETLIAAVDAAGRRSGVRLPLVIDGLNEAEDPRKWKGHLASIGKIVGKYPYLLVVCTVRGNELADEALPEDIRRVEITDFGDDSIDAIRKYFKYYKIDAGDADLPYEMLRHPLTLRLFCDVTNPTRQAVVGIEAMPRSLTSLFFTYLETAAERIAELSASNNRLFAQDVKNAITLLGKTLWEASSRGVSETQFRKVISDELRLWQHSVVRALEQEGVILRSSLRDETIFGWHNKIRNHGRQIKTAKTISTPADMQITFVYDAMAGHVIADALAVERGAVGFGKWIQSASVRKKFDFTNADRHPLGSDIMQSLCGILPRRLNGQQLWPFLKEPYRTTALVEVMKAEGSAIDEKTERELQRMILSGGPDSSDILTRLFYTRAAIAHPLNARFLDSTLRKLSMPDRDLLWSEWIRGNEAEFIKDARGRQRRWKQTSERAEADALRALWFMWLLTSTVHDLRDEATKALFWYGRNAASELFAMTLTSLEISDPYVSERMIAASYGIAMASHQCDVPFRDKSLPSFARSLFDEMFSATARHSTTHALTRDYARRLIELASLHHPAVLNKKEIRRVRPPFPGMHRQTWKNGSGVYSERFHGPIRMDFGNYTIGQLIDGRANYQYNHPEYQDVMKKVLWRIKNLGFDENRFQSVDSSISGNDYRGRSNRGGSKIDRYGKKYSWIAYFEMAGERIDQGKVEKWSGDYGRLSDVDIDPSFPEKLPKFHLGLPKMDPGSSLSKWLSRTDAPNVKSLLKQDTIRNCNGPWVLLSGYFHQRDPEQRVGLHCNVRAVFISSADFKKVEKHLKSLSPFSTHELDNPSVHYSFVGEAGWADTWPTMGDAEWNFVVGKTKRNGPKIDFLDVDPFSGERKGKPANKPQRMSWFVDVHESVKVLLPVFNNGWESYHTCTNEGRCPLVLGREVSDALHLYVNCETSEFMERDGKLASINVQEFEDDDQNQEFLYLREDLLNSFLKMSDRRMFFVVLGERELHTRDVDGLSEMYGKHGTPVFFKEVTEYTPVKKHGTNVHKTVHKSSGASR